jgi:hypothetical protein
MSDDIKTGLMGLALIVNIVWNLYQYNKSRHSDVVGAVRELEDVKHRVYGLETKVGLFWHLVEEHMSNMLPHGNPIHLTIDEQVAGRLYNVYKAKTPTHILKKLEPAITRELRQRDEEGKHKYMTADEIVAFTCILGAIKSQLFDRGEWQPEDDQRD